MPSLHRFLATTLLSTLALGGCAAEADEPTTSDVEELTAQNVRAILAPITFHAPASLTDGTAVPAVRNGDHLVMNLPFAPFAGLRAQLDDALGGRLKHRGEAHITIVTPPEAHALSSKVSVAEMHAIAATQHVQSSTWQPVCVGVGSAPRDLHTFFVVANAPQLVAIRQAIADLFRSRGGAASAFDPDAFDAHVTIGFTKRDLFEGVHKDASSCARANDLVITHP